MQVQLKSPAATYVLSASARSGSRVQAGDALYRLASDEEEIRLSEATSQLEQSRHHLAQLQSADMNHRSDLLQAMLDQAVLIKKNKQTVLNDILVSFRLGTTDFLHTFDPLQELVDADYKQVACQASVAQFAVNRPLMIEKLSGIISALESEIEVRQLRINMYNVKAPTGGLFAMVTPVGGSVPRGGVVGSLLT